MFKVYIYSNQCLYLNLQVDVFMNTLALIFDFKEVQSHVCFVIVHDFFFFSYWSQCINSRSPS